MFPFSPCYTSPSFVVARLILTIVLSISSVVSFAESAVSVTSQYYQFKAHDKKSIWKGIVDQSPKVSMEGHANHKVIVGLTEWRMAYRYRFKAVPYHCEVKAFTVTTDISIHLPFWEDKWKATPELQGAWDSYVRMVSDHENVHKSYAIRTAERIDRDVLAIGVVRDCEDLKVQIEEITRQHIQQNRMDNRWFDAKEKIYQKNAIWF